MTGQFHLHGGGLTPLSNIHAEVAQGLKQLASDGGPHAADIAQSFGTVASGLNSALDGASQSRLSAFQVTQTAGSTISDLLNKAHQMYMQGDEQGGDKLKAAAEAMEASGGGSGGGAGSAGGSTGAGGGSSVGGGSGASGAGGAGSSGGGGAEMASQMASQVGQQVGQVAQSLAQSVQGLTQGLTQLPQQLMQSLQGLGGSAASGRGAEGGKAHEAATGSAEKAAEDRDKDGKPDDERAEEERRHQATPPAHAEGAQPGHTSEGNRAPVAPTAPATPQPAQTRPQQSPL
jgi:hypothetical protein